ncbi:hypothetical protein J7E70_07900 [Variovorax paradoxus]|nr:hypothetical protein [Variovorax paradoxus]MBT2300386.1 hypothetical protein [Variovorax paradoxus]
MKRKLTNRQLSIFVYMRDFFKENDQLPPQATLSEHFGWKSYNAAALHQKALASKGYLEKNAVGKYRFTREGAGA